jgi:hypothetical protein
MIKMVKIKSKLKLKSKQTGVERLCPYCGHKNNSIAAETFRNQPIPEITPGDISICIACAEISQFDKELILIKTTPKMIREMLPEDLDTVLRYQTVVKRMLHDTTKH